MSNRSVLNSEQVLPKAKWSSLHVCFLALVPMWKFPRKEPLKLNDLKKAFEHVEGYQRVRVLMLHEKLHVTSYQ